MANLPMVSMRCTLTWKYLHKFLEKFKITLVFQQCCGSGMFIPDTDPEFYPSRISDTGSKNSNKREGWKKICCHTLLCSHKIHKIENYFSCEVPKKKILSNFQRIIELFTQKIVTALKNMGLGSEIRDPENTYSILNHGSGFATLCFRAWGKMIHEKNLKQKILWLCPFNPMPEAALSPSQGLWIWPLKRLIVWRDFPN